MRPLVPALVLLAGFGATGAGAAEAQRFLVIGDLPYTAEQNHRLENTIAPAIKNAGHPFLIHLGDFKASSEACTKDLFIERRDQMNALRPGRVFYTPGDNDWTDCDRPWTGRPMSELGRLDLLRRLFFTAPPDPPADWAYSRQPSFPENARWRLGGVVFATVHVVGTNNGRNQILKDDIAAALSLVAARDRANRVWLAAAFAAADAAGARTVVIATHADVTDVAAKEPCTADIRRRCDGFAGFRSQLTRHAAAFGKPVLLVHGDTRPYCLDQGFGGTTAPGLWRLNAAGDDVDWTDATEITVQPDGSFAILTLVGRKQPRDGCD
ncbi:MAG: hypothetical protein ACE5JZ_00925 [Kiloniellales bacterium]